MNRLKRNPHERIRAGAGVKNKKLLKNPHERIRAGAGERIKCL
jgi:hypothetical protein